MEAVISKDASPQEELTRSWVLYISSKQEVARIQREIDIIFSPYSFYPEIDWTRYGYRPPENYQVLGAWRNPNPKNKVFAFLLDNPRMLSLEPTTQLLLHVVGVITEIKQIEPRIDTLKAKYELQNKKENADLIIKERLDEMGNSKSLAVFNGLLLVFTAIVNGFALYLRQLPPPDLPSKTLVYVYQTTLALVHFSALGLLLIVIVLSIIFSAKFGALIIRKR